MNLKSFISKIFWSSFSSKKKIEKYQKIIRDSEWSELKQHIPNNIKFLDVGCGSGDNLYRAKDELSCDVFGIDPMPGSHGVGRFSENQLEATITIEQGFSENLPYKDNFFDVVFCSHVLEHVNDERKSLNEMKRVLKDDGVLIIGMPTALMAWISLLSNYIFTTHAKILSCLKTIGKKEFFNNIRYIFLPNSHSYPKAKTILYDLYHYRVKNWKNIVSKEFKINTKLTPYLYPFPDYPQFFRIRKSKIGSSSVFFICKKK